MIYKPLQDFANAVSAKMSQLTVGEPEDQLRGPFENLIQDVAKAIGWNIVCTGETPLPERLGIPDYALHLNKCLEKSSSTPCLSDGITRCFQESRHSSD